MIDSFTGDFTTWLYFTISAALRPANGVAGRMKGQILLKPKLNTQLKVFEIDSWENEGMIRIVLKSICKLN